MSLENSILDSTNWDKKSCVRSLSGLRSRVLLHGLCAVMSMCVVWVSGATEISMIAKDSGSASSFNTGTNWAGGAVPINGNTYFTAGNNLQTPLIDNVASNHIFGGDQLTLNGGYLVWKSLGQITIPALIVDGGYIANWRGNTVGRIYGSMTINAGKTLIIAADEPDLRAFHFFTDIMGTGLISVRMNQVSTLKQTYFYGNSCNFTGRIEIRGRGSFGVIHESGLGANPTSYTADQLEFNGATFVVTNDLALTAPHRGIKLNNTLNALSSIYPGGVFEVADGCEATIACVINGAGTLTKRGNGILVLATNNTYTGSTIISNGVVCLGVANALSCEGDGLTTSTVQIATGAVLDLGGFTQKLAGLAGNGTVSNGTLCANVSPSGTNVIGTLTVGPGITNLSGVYLVDVNQGGCSDQMNVNGDLDLSGLSLRVTDTTALNNEAEYVLATCTGSVMGYFATHNLPAGWKVVYLSNGSGSSVKLISSDTSSLVFPDMTGRLAYVPDGRGNRIPDFSCAGYRGGGVPLPDVPIVMRLAPSGSDDTLAIQNAIKWVASNVPLNAQGFRGAVFLSRGVYRITNTLTITSSGIVLRGEGPYGNGTVIFHQGKIQQNTISIYGGVVSNVFKTALTDTYVPVGSKQITVASTDGLSIGQMVAVRCFHSQKWIDTLSQTAYWPLNSFALRWERTITNIDTENNVLTLDAPITSQIDQGNLYAQGEVQTFHTNTRVSNIGIEDVILMSDYDRSVKDAWGYFSDEQHADIGIHIVHASDCWVRRVTGFFYYWCLVRARDVVYRVTVEDCAMIDGVSTDTPMNHTGTRDYYFALSGSQTLCQRSYGRYGRHTFIMGGPVSGNVFLDCYAEKEHLSCEPHQWWTSGSLYDNVYTDAIFKLNRSEGDHGQRAANCLLWNVTCANQRDWDPDISLDTPISDLGKQWAIGIINVGTGLGIASPSPESTNSVAAYTESVGAFVTPRSIYLAQLRDRLGDEAVEGITTQAQRTSGQAVWDNLLEQYSTIPEFGDPSDLSWLPKKQEAYVKGLLIKVL